MLVVEGEGDNQEWVFADYNSLRLCDVGSCHNLSLQSAFKRMILFTECHKAALGSRRHAAFILQDLHKPNSLKFAVSFQRWGHLPESGTSSFITMACSPISSAW